MDGGTGQKDALPTADNGRGWRKDTPDAVAVGARAHVDVGLDATNHELRAAFEARGGALCDRAKIVVATRGAALRLDLRDFEAGARLGEQPLDDGDGVDAVGVEHDERARGANGESRADAHGVFAVWSLDPGSPPVASSWEEPCASCRPRRSTRA